ncbi:MAG: DUF1178 family protein, partial [Pseudomonadota bacterium]
FQSADAFDTLEKAGHLSCVVCGGTDVTRSLMAPKVRTARKAADAAPQISQADMEKTITEMRANVEENSEYVGMNFAAKARAMHLGEEPEKSIYGSAKPEDAKSLIEDGIPVTPLPFMPKRNTN